WIFVNFPIPQLHANAVAAAEFAMCAARQGKFWPAHDRLYATQDQWEALRNPGPFFLAQVKPLGLDEQPVLACLQSGETRATIRSDAEGAARSGAGSTPSFYIEGGILEGAQPIAVFRHVLDRSEEHTSELQSRENLVCRLLLEKKKNITYFSAK